MICELCGKEITTEAEIKEAEELRLDWCKKCIIRISQFGDKNYKSRLYNATHREQLKQYRKKYYQKNKEKIKELTKKNLINWKEKNKEHLKEYRRKYYQKNKERCNSYTIAWQRKNKEKVKEYRNRWQLNKKLKFEAFLKELRNETNKE